MAAGNGSNGNGAHRWLPQEDIAIVGMSCLYPGAADLESYWQNVLSKIDAISEPPEEWGREWFFEADERTNDRIYTSRGGHLGALARFEPTAYGVMPLSVDGTEPDHFLALRLASDALNDASINLDTVDEERIEVILGGGTYIKRGGATLFQHGVAIDQTIRVLHQLHPEYTTEELQTIKQGLKANLPPFNAETAPGLIPNIITGRIANRLNLRGANYIVDAACASTLIAVERAMQDLLLRKCDVALAGGIHASTIPTVYMVFCQLSALSHSGQIRPFDRRADGTLLGEGAGVMVLKRRADAERDGDRIYALIKGVGVASDGRGLGLMAPRIEGEVLALQHAYEMAGVEPSTVGLVEAHGTGTPLGDATEIRALREVFGTRSNGAGCAIGTVKSMIGHSLQAAGAAGIIKAAMALHHKVLPPTLHCEEPIAELSDSPFYLNRDTRPWIHGSPSHPRRAGVNAFGFGGINAHVILEEYVELSKN